MIGIASNLTALLTAKPSKHTIIALAILGTILALTLITGVHAGRPIDGIGLKN
jgi:phosphotransferase system  glucose/maltose/N-acetylglucosamine-specific IIC component